MRLIVNSQQTDIDAATIADVIKAFGYEGNYFAVALNMTCIRRAHYTTTLIKDGDEVEILTPMQGG